MNKPTRWTYTYDDLVEIYGTQLNSMNDEELIEFCKEQYKGTDFQIEYDDNGDPETISFLEEV